MKRKQRKSGSILTLAFAIIVGTIVGYAAMKYYTSTLDATPMAQDLRAHPYVIDCRADVKEYIIEVDGLIRKAYEHREYQVAMPLYYPDGNAKTAFRDMNCLVDYYLEHGYSTKTRVGFFNEPLLLTISW